MKDSDKAQQKCCICGKELTDNWFCRVPHDGGALLMCSPTCAVRYCERLYPAENPDVPKVHQLGQG